MDSRVYQRPAKPRRLTVRRRRPEAPTRAPLAPPAIVTVDRATECHVTPPAIAARMVEALGPLGAGRVLEPSAGTGALVAALLEAGGIADRLVVIERAVALCDAIRQRFASVDGFEARQACFLDYAETAHRADTFDQIVMNPPFRHARAHVAAALSRLADRDATLVALVPITLEHADAETLDELPVDTFASTRVHTKLVRIER